MHERKKNKKSALKVIEGVEHPSPINKEAVNKFIRKKNSLLNADEYVKGILEKNRTILSQAITLVESSLPQHHKIAQKIIEKCLPHSGNSIRIGITGTPGVGKSTFIESLGVLLSEQNRNIAVLAIDPSSMKSKGSILGDKTRMEDLSTKENVFIRPSPSAGSLGGVARKTKEIIILCEASGFDTIFVETVGVGQSEIAVHSMVDFFLLLMLAGAGDELQGIKRGIMEMADAIVINKADGDNISKAKLAKREFQNALHLFPPTESTWIPKVKLCSSIAKTGITQIWEMILDYIELTKSTKFFTENRLRQEKNIMFATINQTLKDNFYSNNNISKIIPEFEKEVLSGKISAYIAAQKLFEKYFDQIIR